MLQNIGAGPRLPLHLEARQATTSTSWGLSQQRGTFSTVITLSDGITVTLTRSTGRDPEATGTKEGDEEGQDDKTPFVVPALSPTVITSDGVPVTVFPAVVSMRPGDQTDPTRFNGTAATSTSTGIIGNPTGAVVQEDCDPGDIDGAVNVTLCPTRGEWSGNGTTNGAACGTTSESKGAPAGAIAGGVIGGILGLAVLLALLFLFLRRRKRPQRVGRSLENEPFVVDDRNEHGPETASHKSGASKKGPKTYSTTQIAEIEKTRQASGGGNGAAFVPVMPYKDHREDKEKLGVAGLRGPERKPSSRGRTDRTVTSVSLTDYDSGHSMESLDEKPKLDKGKGKAKLPSVCLSMSSREDV